MQVAMQDESFTYKIRLRLVSLCLRWSVYRIQEVAGSIPIISTMKNKVFVRIPCFFT